MASLTRTVRAADGTPILTRRWPFSNAIAPDAPWAHVLLVHGLGEHSGRYEQVGELKDFVIAGASELLMRKTKGPWQTYSIK